MGFGTFVAMGNLAGNQVIVIDLNGTVRVLAEGESPRPGEVIVQANTDPAVDGQQLQVELVDAEGVPEDITGEVEDIIAALEDGQDPTQLGDDFATAAGGQISSSLTASGSVTRVGTETIASTEFSTQGFESLGLSQTQSLSLLEQFRLFEPVFVDINDDPLGESISVVTDEDIAISGTLTATDQNAIDILTFSQTTAPSNGTAVVNPDGTWTYTPNENYNGPDSFTVVVDDGNGGTDTLVVNIDVAPVNDVPVAEPQERDLLEDQTITGTLTATDVDLPVGESLVFTTTSTVEGLTLNSDGSYTFDASSYDRLAEGEELVIEVPVTVTDDLGATDDTTLTITVTGTNDVPVAKDGTGTTEENRVLNSNVPAASDVDGTVDSNGYSLKENVGTGNGTLTFNSDGSYRFNPGSDFDDLGDGESRDVTFTYTAKDDDGAESAPKTITITVTGSNDGPAAHDDTYNQTSHTVLFTESFENMTSTGRWTVIDGKQLGDWTANNGLEIQHESVVNKASDGQYIAELDAHENTVITTSIDTAGQDSVKVEFDFNPRRDGDESSSMTFSFGGEQITVNADGTLSDVPAWVDASISTVPSADGWYTVTAEFDVDTNSTQLSFAGAGTSDSYGALLDNIKVTGINQPNLVTEEDTPITISFDELLANDTDVDGDDLSIILTSISQPLDEDGLPVAKDFDVDYENGTITFTPANDYNGEVTFTYKVTDGNGAEDEATVTLNVTPVNDPPESEDFLATVSSTGKTQIVFDDIDEAKDHISDIEDDAAGKEIKVVITELPDEGLLYLDLGNGQFRALDKNDLFDGQGTPDSSIQFSPDAIHFESGSRFEGFSLGISDDSRDPVGDLGENETNQEFYNWGEEGANSKERILTLENGEKITVTGSKELYQYRGDANHIGHGLSVGKGDGINAGETITIDLSEHPADSIKVGLDGLGGYFFDTLDVGHDNRSYAIVKVTLEDDSGIKTDHTYKVSNTENNGYDIFEQITIPSDTFQLDMSGSKIVSVEFGTEGRGNWELRSFETSTDDSFDYQVVDTDGNLSEVSTVTLEQGNNAPDANDDPAGWTVNLGEFNGDDWSIVPGVQSITASFGTETPTLDISGKYLGVAGHRNGGIEQQIQYDRDAGISEQVSIKLDKPATEFSFSVSNLFKNEGDFGGNHEQGKWVAYLDGVAVASGMFTANETNNQGSYTIDSDDLNGLPVDQVVFESVDFAEVPARGSDSSDYFLTGFSASNSSGNYAGFQGDVVRIPVEQLLANDSDEDGDSIRITYVFGEDNGTARIVEENGKKYVEFDLDDNFTGDKATFNYQITDDQGGFDEATVTVDVHARPEPEAKLMSIEGTSADEGDNLVYQVSLGDGEGNAKGPLEAQTFTIAIGVDGDAADKNSDVDLGEVGEGEVYKNVVFTNGVTYKDGQITVPAGVSKFAILIPTVKDGIYEQNENFTVTIGEGTDLISSSPEIVNIDEYPIVESISSFNVEEGATASFTVELSNPSQRETEVTMSLEDHSARSVDGEPDKGDYNAKKVDITLFASADNPSASPITLDAFPDSDGNFTVKVPAGYDSFTVDVITNNDDHPDDRERFTLSGKTAQQDTAEVGVATILDNEAPTIDLNGAEYDIQFVSEGAGYSNVFGYYIDDGNGGDKKLHVLIGNNNELDPDVGSLLAHNGLGPLTSIDNLEFFLIPGGSHVVMPDNFDRLIVLSFDDQKGNDNDDDDFDDIVIKIVKSEPAEIHHEVTFVEGNESGVAIATSDADIFDDKDTIESMTITLTKGDANDVLNTDIDGFDVELIENSDDMYAVKVTYLGDNGQSQVASASVFESYLKSLRFGNDSDTPSEETRSVEIKVFDDKGQFATATTTINVVDLPTVESISSFDVEEGATASFTVELSNPSQRETEVTMSLEDH
ncbi:tandem-95 repeat protein, partial [Vibrio sp. M260118]|uniref:tandem-95 repeat protein n=1 Tax=Vibrio sp. M260118 TaxID=3020896 RepID=UPI002F3F09C3